MTLIIYILVFLVRVGAEIANFSNQLPVVDLLLHLLRGATSTSNAQHLKVTLNPVPAVRNRNGEVLIDPRKEAADQIAQIRSAIDRLPCPNILLQCNNYKEIKQKINDPVAMGLLTWYFRF